MIQLNKTYSSLLCGFLVTILILITYSFSPQWLEPLENLSQNIHFKLRSPLPPSSNIIIAKIDEKSIDSLGRWPWSRQTMAALVRRLKKFEAKVIGFDMIFSSAQTSTNHEGLNQLKRLMDPTKNTKALIILDQLLTDADAQLSQALAEGPKSVLGYFFHFSSEGLDHLTLNQRKHYFEDIKASRFSGFLKSNANLELSSLAFPTAFAVESNITALSKTANRSGFLSFDLESDGTVRQLPLIVRYLDSADKKDYFFPPFSLRILEQYLDATLLFRVNESGMEEVILDHENPIVIPTNSKGEMEINYLGPRGTFPSISISDLLDNITSPETLEAVRNKIVLIGATATALEDLRSTPFDPALPGVEIHATVIDNILSNRFLTQPSWKPSVDILYLLLTGIFLTAVYSRIQPRLIFLVWPVSTCALFYLSHWIFLSKGFWLTDIYPVFENIGIATTIMLGRYIQEEKQKQFIKKVFSQYLSPRVIKELTNDPSKLKLGGEQKELTALFTDLEGFSTFSEQLAPTELVDLLNTYLTEMTNILMEYEGTLDRYDGDAIKAFFGAPVYFDDHARRACLVCIDMQNKLKAMRMKLKKEGKPELLMRVGLNTGSMVIGNMGSTTRMMYGMNGDSVNLCARLEGANKQYGTYSLISESTYKQAKEFIEVRELDNIRVVGRATPIKIYELLGKKGEIEESLKKVLPVFNQGLMNYQNREWDEAKRKFENILISRPDDGPSKVYLERCNNFILNPPPDDWDGVFNLTTK